MRGGSNVYSLPENLFSRSMCAVLACADSHRFLISTCSLHKSNEIHAITYLEDSNRIDVDAVFTVEQGEVWSMAASPYNRQVFACGVEGKEGEWAVGMYDTGEVKEIGKEQYDKRALKVKAEMKGEHSNNIHSICWEDNEPNEGGVAKELLTADSDKVVLWDLKQTKPKTVIDTTKLPNISSDL